MLQNKAVFRLEAVISKCYKYFVLISLHCWPQRTFTFYIGGIFCSSFTFVQIYTLFWKIQKKTQCRAGEPPRTDWDGQWHCVVVRLQWSLIESLLVEYNNLWTHWSSEVIGSKFTVLVSVAQLVAHRTHNRKVVGSIPADAVCFTVDRCLRPLWPATTPSS